MNKTHNSLKFFAFLFGINLAASLYLQLTATPKIHLLSSLLSCGLIGIVGVMGFWLGQRRAEFKHSNKSLAMSAALCWVFFSGSGFLGAVVGLVLSAVAAAILGWRGGALVASNRAQQGIQPDGPASGGSAG